jgi:hypothetical protein
LILVKDPERSAELGIIPLTCQGWDVRLTLVEIKMLNVQRVLGVAGVVLMASFGSMSSQAVASTAHSGLQAYAQAAQPSATTGVKTWTRSRLAAAQKRWAQNQEKFSDCTKQLAEAQKKKRLSIHDRGHFLEGCMYR